LEFPLNISGIFLELGGSILRSTGVPDQCVVPVVLARAFY
jgi:hypothetical protein